MGLGEQENDAGIGQHLRRHLRLQPDPHTQRFQNIGSAASGRGSAIAMLGHRHTRARHDKGHGSGNIERAMAVAAGAAQVNRIVRRIHRQHVIAHGTGRAGNLRHGGFAVGGGGEIGQQLLVAQLAFENPVEQAFGFCGAERFFANPHQVKNVAHAGCLAKSRARVRKFCKSAWPFSDAMLSG